jgi:sirohydrochlorin ferrochelatase
VADAKRAILIVDHGSRRAEANELLDEVARRVQARCPDAIVRAAHMELAPPSIAEAIEACVAAGAGEIVVHPYFLAPGRHSTRDIPHMVDEAMSRHPGITARVTPPLGLHDQLIDVVLQRVDEPTD